MPLHRKPSVGVRRCAGRAQWRLDRAATLPSSCRPGSRKARDASSDGHRKSLHADRWRATRRERCAPYQARRSRSKYERSHGHHAHCSGSPPRIARSSRGRRQAAHPRTGTSRDRSGPEIVAIVRGQAVHQSGDLVLLSDAARAADQAVRVRGTGDDQRVTRPRGEMGIQGRHRGLGLAREHEVEETDVTGLTLGQPEARLLAAARAARAAPTSPCLIRTCALPAWAKAKPGSAAMARS